MRPFRFGLQLAAEDPVAAVATARQAEAVGFDVVHTSDHVGPGNMAPLAPFAAIAVATERIRLCPLVLNNDFHHPVDLAREVIAIDHLSGGRMELGLGAGHSEPEYRMVGIPFDAPVVRKARLAESVEILRRLLDGEMIDHAGEHYRLVGAGVGRSHQAHLPILVGVNGSTALAHAACHADTIGLTGLGRTLEDGQHHETRWEADRLDRTVGNIGRESAAAGRSPELHALVQMVVVTDDREAAALDVVRRGLVSTVADALATPFLAVGTHEQIASHLRECRERWGISYFSVRTLEDFAPVIRLIRAGS